MKTFYKIFIAGLCLVIFLASAGFSPPSLDIRATYYYEKGLAYEQAGEYASAEQQIKIALKKDPEMAAAHLALGAVYLKGDRLDAAEASTMGAVSLLLRIPLRGYAYHQTLSMAYNNLGAIEQKRGLQALQQLDVNAIKEHWQKSNAYYHTAVEIDPKNSCAQINLRRPRPGLN